VKLVRWWLSLAYILATMLALGVHDHDRETGDPILESRGDCEDPRPHVANHEAAVHGDSPTVCPSCQFRSQHSLWVMASRPQPGPSVAIPLATLSPFDPPRVAAPDPLPSPALRLIDPE